MISLAKLLWLDDECIPDEGIEDCFGDRYLCANNGLFLNIRRHFLSSGCRYSCEPTRFWCDYDSFSLLMLQEILDSGVVPYKDNGTTLRRILARAPSLELPANMLLEFVQHNHVLHESAHCIAYRLLCPRFSVRGPSSKELYVLVSIICEAYANCVECIGAAFAKTDVHRVFYAANSFFEGRPRTCSLIRESSGIFGLEEVFRLGMLAFFYLNTHTEGAGDEAVSTIINATFRHQALTDAKRLLSRVLVDQTFGLSRKFRSDTTPLFFKYVGCEKEFQDLCRQRFDVVTLSSNGVLDAVANLSAATCEGLLPDQLLSQPKMSTEFGVEEAAEVISERP